jgi:hypothetical protein
MTVDAKRRLYSERTDVGIGRCALRDARCAPFVMEIAVDEKRRLHLNRGAVSAAVRNMDLESIVAIKRYAGKSEQLRGNLGLSKSAIDVA